MLATSRNQCRNTLKSFFEWRNFVAKTRVAQWLTLIWPISRFGMKPATSSCDYNRLIRQPPKGGSEVIFQFLFFILLTNKEFHKLIKIIYKNGVMLNQKIKKIITEDGTFSSSLVWFRIGRLFVFEFKSKKNDSIRPENWLAKVCG